MQPIPVPMFICVCVCVCVCVLVGDIAHINRGNSWFEKEAAFLFE